MRQEYGTRVPCFDKSCRFYLCDDCYRWHIDGQCKAEKFSVPPGFRMCPNCNHIHCRCGKHYCFYCEEGPWDDSSSCYNHMGTHRDSYGDPPDYRKYVLGQSVSDAELEEFYRKYPKFKNRKIVDKQPNQPRIEMNNIYIIRT